MAPRASWKGTLKLSLVSCPIQLFPATSEREKVRFHQLNRDTGNRIRYVKVDAESGDEVASDDIVKGYEVAKGDYVELEPDERQRKHRVGSDELETGRARNRNLERDRHVALDFLGRLSRPLGDDFDDRRRGIRIGLDVHRAERGDAGAHEHDERDQHQRPSRKAKSDQTAQHGRKAAFISLRCRQR